MLGLTQEELASKVGYSVRLIRKAESGKSISPETASDLQTFFNESVPNEDRTTLLLDNLQIVKTIMDTYHNMGSGLTEVCKHFFHDEFVFTSTGNPEEFPLAGTYKGLGGFHEFLSKLESIYERDPNTWEIEFFTSGPKVMASYIESFEVDGERLENLRTFLQFSFQDGLVVALTDDYDTGRNTKFWQRVREN